jgi:hypothetical protein
MNTASRPARIKATAAGVLALAVAAGGAFHWTRRHSHGVEASRAEDTEEAPPRSGGPSATPARVAPPKFNEAASAPDGPNQFQRMAQSLVDQFAGKEALIDAAIPRVAPRVPLTPEQVTTLQRWNHTFARAVREIYASPVTTQEDMVARRRRLFALAEAKSKAGLQLFKGDIETAMRAERMISSSAAGVQFDQDGWPVPNEFGRSHDRVTTPLWDKDTSEFDALFD